MNVMVTGGSGFIGTNLMEHYAHLGCNVLNIDIAPPRNSAHLRYWKQLDIRDSSQLHKAVHTFSPNLILHMAARTDLEGKSLSDYSANTDGVQEMIKVAGDLPDLHRVIFASSMLVCALGYAPKNDSDYCPTTRYGESKVIGEGYVRDLAKGRFAWTIVRPTSFWGPWFDVPYKNFFEAVAKRVYMHPKGRRICRSYGFVLNAIHQIGRIASYRVSDLVDERTLYLADYQPIDLLHWANVISTQCGVLPPRELPLGLLRCCAVVGDSLKQMGVVHHPSLTTFRLNNLLTEAVFDLSPVESIVGTLPYDMKQGVEITVDWMRKAREGV